MAKIQSNDRFGLIVQYRNEYVEMEWSVVPMLLSRQAANIRCEIGIIDRERGSSSDVLMHKMR